MSLGPYASFIVTSYALVALVLAETSLDQALAEAKVKVEGDAQVFARFLALLDRFDFWFEIIAP